MSQSTLAAVDQFKRKNLISWADPSFMFSTMTENVVVVLKGKKKFKSHHFEMTQNPLCDPMTFLEYITEMLKVKINRLKVFLFVCLPSHKWNH